MVAHQFGAVTDLTLKEGPVLGFDGCLLKTVAFNPFHFRTVLCSLLSFSRTVIHACSETDLRKSNNYKPLCVPLVSAAESLWEPAPFLQNGVSDEEKLLL